MKILIVSQYFWPEDFKVNDIAFDFVQKGHDVTVLTAKPNYPQGKFYKGYGFFSNRKEEYKGVKIIRTPIVPRRSGGALFLALNYLSFIFFAFFTSRFRIKGDFDIIFCHLTSPITSALPAIWLKKRFKIPLVIWVLDLWPESVASTTNIKSKLFYKYLSKLVSYIYDKSDHILVSSRNFIESIKGRVTNQDIPITYFPNWAEDVFIQRQNESYELPQLPAGFNIMFAGNIGEAQDFESIVNAAKHTLDHEINWLIVGDGRKYEWLKSEIEKNHLTNISLLGRFPLQAMPSFFKKADAMLVSLKNEPIFELTVPAKIQAYMASGKIILGMINGEANQLINESGCGYAVAAADYKALSDKAIALRNLNLSERQVMEAQAKNYYQKHFSKPMLFQKLEDLLKD
jgi:glycosyltransferase involved in cell wall biosynthesis